MEENLKKKLMNELNAITEKVIAIILAIPNSEWSNPGYFFGRPDYNIYTNKPMCRLKGKEVFFIKTKGWLDDGGVFFVYKFVIDHIDFWAITTDEIRDKYDELDKMFNPEMYESRCNQLKSDIEIKQQIFDCKAE